MYAPIIFGNLKKMMFFKVSNDISSFTELVIYMASMYMFFQRYEISTLEDI